MSGLSKRPNPLYKTSKLEDGTYELNIAAPGFEKKDFDISVKEDVLSLEFSSEENIFFKGSFKESFELPRGYFFDKITASYKKGILSLKIPPKEKTVDKKIKIL
ncbi:Hsp20/alpha crystallin family protein [bacterium]|nr:Hsp20/alpha crystallin family protein [bacterium]